MKRLHLISHFFRFLKRFWYRHVRHIAATPIPHDDSCSKEDDSSVRLSMQYIYGVYDDHEQFSSIACFPSDEAAVHFYVNCHLGSPTFPCSCLYRLAIMNVDTGSIESIDPVSLHGQVLDFLKKAMKEQDEFREYFSSYLSTLRREEVADDGKA